ncbi:MAG: CsbD family protein [Burkholderiales bacterium]|nr:CsbD family protein [Burkholderiales bacterium]
MNKDQVKGTVKDAIGNIQEQAGKLIDSPDQQAKGLHKQVEGKTQKVVGDLKELKKDLVGK